MVLIQKNAIQRILGEDVKRSSGQDARRSNLLAARLIAELMKNSLGPRGLEKMFVDIMGEVTVTKDGATLLRKIDVEHPAAKVLIEASNSVDNEVGDGTKAVVVVIGALLEKAEEMLDKGISPAMIIDGYQSALELALVELENLAEKHAGPDKDTMGRLVQTSLDSKSLGPAVKNVTDMIVDAALSVADSSRKSIDVDNIKIEQKLGDMSMTQLIKGMVVDKTIDSSSMPKSIEKARIMLIDDDLEGRTTRTGSQININSPKLMMSFKKEETEEIRSKVKHIIESGANVVFSRKGINTLAQHLLAREGIISVRRVKENDLLWLARATGASIAARLDHEHEVHYGSDGHDHDHHSHEHKHAHTHSERYSTRHDDFHPHYHHGDIDIKLGFAERVSERVIGDDRMVFVESCRNPRAVTILLRAGSKRTLDEFQRSTIDGISVLRDYFTKPAIISGGGSAEAAIAKRLRNTANSIPSREQIVLSMFADALEEIPLTLARNAGMDVINTLATLRHEHRDDNRGHTGRGKTYGVDVFGRKVSQMYPAVVEPVLVKEQVLKTATEVANLLLRVDDVLMAKPAMNTHTHANGTTHSHGGGDKAHQHDYFDRLGKMQRPSHHYY